jgi:hypothetical protein
MRSNTCSVEIGRFTYISAHSRRRDFTIIFVELPMACEINQFFASERLGMPVATFS